MRSNGACGKQDNKSRRMEEVSKRVKMEVLCERPWLRRRQGIQEFVEVLFGRNEVLRRSRSEGQQMLDVLHEKPERAE